jgi:hypothetical protein
MRKPGIERNPSNERFVRSGSCQERSDSSFGAAEDRRSFGGTSAMGDGTILVEENGHEDEALAKGCSIWELRVPTPVVSHLEGGMLDASHVQTHTRYKTRDADVDRRDDIGVQGAFQSICDLQLLQAWIVDQSYSRGSLSSVPEYLVNTRSTRYVSRMGDVLHDRRKRRGR